MNIRIENETSIQVKLAKTILLAFLTLILAGCFHNIVKSPPDELMGPIQACSGIWGAEVSAEVAAEYQSQKRRGELQLKAAVEAGGTIVRHFDNEALGLAAYDKYLVCIKPAVDKFVAKDQRLEDQRPRVVIIGSREDYTTYRLPALEATSVELLDKRFNFTFRTQPITVSYGWNDEEAVRRANPAVVVIHASAFHDNQFKDEAINKFQALITSLYGMPNTKFLVFSRVPPDNPDPDLCQRWKRQISFLSREQFKDRLFFYPLARNESDFAGAAGIEISQIVRCQSGLEAKDYCSIILREKTDEALKRISNSTCKRYNQ